MCCAFGREAVTTVLFPDKLSGAARETMSVLAAVYWYVLLFGIQEHLALYVCIERPVEKKLGSK